MARRRKRQTKKAVAEAEAPVEEADSSVTEEDSSHAETSQQEEETTDPPAQDGENATIGQGEDTETLQNEEAKMVTEEKKEDPVLETVETSQQDDEETLKQQEVVKQEETAPALPEEIHVKETENLATEVDDTKDECEKQDAAHDEKMGSEPVDAEPVPAPEGQEKIVDEDSKSDDAPVEETEPESQEVESMQTEENVEPRKEEVAEQIPADVTNETDQDMMSDETKETIPSEAPETQDDEMKEQAEEKEEDEAPIIKIEKEPTVPYCYDDDKAPVQIDPEGDEGEVVIGNESPEFLKYWRAVLDNPHDFTNWTYLLQLVEQENKPSLARRAYNGFFKRYPLCYGYWKKFSEFEKRNGNLVRAQRILERGVRAIPLSIDLWVHMIDFYINFYKGPDAGNEKIRGLFERAATASGEEFRSEKLWNKYLQWEKENKEWKAVMALYDRVIKLPTQHYAVFFKDFKEFVMSRSPKDLLSIEEFEKLLEEVREDAEKAEKSKKKKEEAKESTDSPAVDDTDPPGVEATDRGKPPNDKELKAVSEKIVSKKKKTFEATEALVTKIWTFEEGVKRPYFHVKALERAQIKNWRDYLEAEMNKNEDNHRRVMLLFERCLIACALYEDFWLKYARYLMKTDPEMARDVYQRACEIHLPKKPNVHMHWASFEELQGNYDAAAKILANLANTLPNLVMVKLRRVAVERRAGHLDAAEELLKGFIEGVETANEKCFYIRKYVWFLVQVSKKVDDARLFLKDAIAKNPSQVQLYKDLVGLEFYYGNEESISEACDLALESSALSGEMKFQFSQRKLEYMEDFGTGAKIVQKAYDDHQKLFRSHKKRLQSTADPSQPATKKAKTEPTSPSSGSKIQTTGESRQTYSAKPTTNGAYSSQVTLSAQPQPATPAQAYQQTAAAGDPSLYYQNYWNYQTQKPDQYQYSQWPQYSQQGYYQQ